MKQSNTIFLASGNPHKIKELGDLLNDLGIDLKSTLDYPDAEEVEENRPDLEGNALKKARYWHQKTGLPALADDTGLEVEVLNGAPGVYSARYAGENASDEENVRKLLHELGDESDRSARFRTVVAFISATGKEHLFEGICAGEIISVKRGKKGFGYDPVFVPDGYEQTFAELSSKAKNRISHRGLAIQKFIQFVK